jgi:hypothetical protein
MYNFTFQSGRLQQRKLPRAGSRLANGELANLR